LPPLVVDMDIRRDWANVTVVLSVAKMERTSYTVKRDGDTGVPRRPPKWPHRCQPGATGCLLRGWCHNGAMVVS